LAERAREFASKRPLVQREKVSSIAHPKGYFLISTRFIINFSSWFCRAVFALGSNLNSPGFVIQLLKDDIVSVALAAARVWWTTGVSRSLIAMEQVDQFKRKFNQLLSSSFCNQLI
jgi:hypothetical protein